MILIQTLGEDLTRLSTADIDRLNNVVAVELLHNADLRKALETKVRSVQRELGGGKGY